MLETLNCRRSASHLALLLAFAAVGVPTVVAKSRQRTLYDRLWQANTHITWRGSIPLRLTASIRSCHLVNEFLYAIGTDGKVSCLRADTGELLWSRRLAAEAETLWPPVAYQSGNVEAVVFAQLNKVLFLDPATGDEAKCTEPDAEGDPQVRRLGPVSLRTPGLASVAVSSESVFVSSTGRRIGRYEIADNYRAWEISTRAPVRLAPIYLAGVQDDTGLLLLASADGLVAAVNAKSREKLFARKLQGTPTGWLATDAKAVYVATSEPRLHALDLATGEKLLEYQLPRRPRGGPVVTTKSVYQTLSGGGLQRVGIKPEWKNWIAHDAKCFLAEWPGRVALLRTDGKIALVKPQTGKTLEVLDLGEVAHAVSNVMNDAVIIASARGEIRCLQPIGAKRLTPADFRPTPPPPTEEPAEVTEAEPTEEPEEAEPGEEPAEGAAEPAEPRMTPLEEILADPLRSRR